MRILPDINLLPATEKRNGTWFLTTIFLLLLFLAGFVGMTIIEAHESEKAEVLQAEKEEMLQLMAAEAGADSELETYKAAVDTIESQIHSVSRLLHEVTAYMPEGSAISGFDYSSPSRLELSMRLLDMKEAAYYQDALAQEQLFNSVTLSSLNYQEVLNEEEGQVEQPIYRYEANYEVMINPKLNLLGDEDAD